MLVAGCAHFSQSRRTIANSYENKSPKDTDVFNNLYWRGEYGQNI